MLQASANPTPQQQDPLANAKLSQYRPVEGPSNRQLRFGLWWVEHHDSLRRLLIGVLVAANLALWGPSAYAWGQYAYDGYFADRALVRALATAGPLEHAAIAARGAREIEIGSTTVIPVLPGGYEVASAVTNPNATWYASFEYAFVAGSDTQTAVWQPGYLLPRQEAYLVDFVAAREGNANIRPQLRNITWRRVGVPADMGALEVREVAVVTEQGSGTPLNRVTFTAVNATPYNFWETEFTLAAQSGGRLVGINKYTLAGFDAGETEAVTIAWPGNWGGARVTVTASADVFDPRNIRPFDLGPGQVK